MRVSKIINAVGGVIGVEHHGNFNFVFSDGKYRLKTKGIKHTIKVLKAITT